MTAPSGMQTVHPTKADSPDSRKVRLGQRRIFGSAPVTRQMYNYTSKQSEGIEVCVQHTVGTYHTF